MPPPEGHEPLCEAILCALLLRTGGVVTLPARAIVDGGNFYSLSIRADDEGAAVMLRAEPVPELN